MEKQSTIDEAASSVCYEAMEAHARERIQCWLQDLLEAEVTQFLGRAKSRRRSDLAEARAGYRNDYGKPRRVALTAGTITGCRPRMRNLAVKAGIADRKAALLVLVGATAAGDKVLLACQAGERESKESWLSVCWVAH